MSDKPFAAGGYVVTQPRDPRVVAADRAAQLQQEWRESRSAWLQSADRAVLSPRDLYRLEKQRRAS